MTRNSLIIIVFSVLLSVPGNLHAQAWSGILKPTSGSGACSFGNFSSPAECAIDWSAAGIPGGIPAISTTCATWYNGSGAPGSGLGGNGDYYFRTDVGHGSAEYHKSSNSWAATGHEFAVDVNSALAACPSSTALLLSAGTYYVSGNITVPGKVVLRGTGANQTILNANGTSGVVISLGSSTTYPNISSDVSITGGTTAGSSSITVSSTPGISVGAYLLITELNDSTYVSITGADGTCTWCDGGLGWNGTRVRGQIVEVTSVSGNTIGISPALYTGYTHTPLATPFSASGKYAGVENLQVFANNTGYSANFAMSECAYCWISGVEGNYTDGDHVVIDYSYRGQIQNSYFSNAFLHTSGTYDSDLVLRNKSTGMLVQNNILERLHSSVMLEWGAAGNVIAYNYMLGDFDSGSNYWTSSDISAHGAHPQFNLIEGNSNVSTHPDSDWGSGSNDTLFRNFIRGTGKNCNPLTGRGTAVCSPMGQPGGSGVNGWWTPEGARAEAIDYEGTNYNTVGNVLGSADMAGLYAYDNPPSGLLTQTRMVVAVCGPAPCGPGSRNNFNVAYNYSLGYGESADDGGSGFDSATPYNTLFLHGDYASATNSITWAPGVTQSLPPSFYLPSKPAWFGNVPWPVIGPDVSGGITNSFGHAYAVPAEVCYETVMGGTDGTGSPLAFNADSCYSSQGGAPAPPSNLQALPQ
jgi:hypothetical protein